MKLSMFAALFAAIFVIGSVPVLLVQPSGAASAGLSAGFMLPLLNSAHVVIFISIGFLASWLGGKVTIVAPLSAVMMLAVGAMMRIDDHLFPAMRGFIVGAILLFSLSMSILQNKNHLLVIPPIALWAYFAGASYMDGMPGITTPIYFMIGTLVSAILMIAIGLSIGITLAESVDKSLDKLKNMPAISSFLSFF